MVARKAVLSGLAVAGFGLSVGLVGCQTQDPHQAEGPRLHEQPAQQPIQQQPNEPVQPQQPPQSEPQQPGTTY